MFTGVAVTLDILVLAGLMACASGLGAASWHGGLSFRRRWLEARDRDRAHHTLAQNLRAEEIAQVLDTAKQHPIPRPSPDHIASALRRGPIDASVAQRVQTWLEGEGFILIDPAPARARGTEQTLSEADFTACTALRLLPAPTPSKAA
ncbi:MAG: hypothetical protein AAFY47_09450 [Pseudomonadota bacterium]